MIYQGVNSASSVRMVPAGWKPTHSNSILVIVEIAGPHTEWRNEDLRDGGKDGMVGRFFRLSMRRCHDFQHSLHRRWDSSHRLKGYTCEGYRPVTHPRKPSSSARKRAPNHPKLAASRIKIVAHML